MKLPSKLRWLNWLAGRMKRPEWIFLGLMCLVTLGAWAFIEIAGEVSEGDADRFDRRILLAFRVDGDPTDPIGPAWVEEAGRDLTALGSLAGLAVVVTSVCGYLWFKGDHSAILYIIFAVVGAQALSSGLKVAFDRPRPDVVPHGDYVYTQSFPSGHSLVSTATYLTLGAMLAKGEQKQRLRVYFILMAMLLAVLIGISRVYLGVHWPTDVLGGWALGAAWALACWAVATYHGARRQRQKDAST